MNSANRERFHNDLLAALKAGVPIEIGDRLSSTSPVLLTERQLAVLHPVAQTAETAATGRDAAPSTPTAAPSSGGRDSDMPLRLSAAARVFDATNQMVPVLRGLSIRALASQDVVRSLRWPFTYIVIVLVVAIIGLQFFALHLVPELELLRNDLRLSRQPESISPDGSIGWISSLAFGFCAALVLLLLAIACGGVRRFAMCVGGTQVVRARVVAAANEVGLLLIRSGVAHDHAARLSTELCNADSVAAASVRSRLATCHAAADIAHESSMAIAASRQHLARIKAVIPAVLVLVVGGAVALLYGTAVFGPVLQLLRDLVVTGV